MDEKELIEMLAAPILEALTSMENAEHLDFSRMPHIHILVNSDDPDGFLDNGLAEKLEAYLQEQLEFYSLPAILH